MVNGARQTIQPCDRASRTAASMMPLTLEYQQWYRMPVNEPRQPVPVIVATGLGRERLARQMQALAGSRAKVAAMTDVEGALAVRDGHADYFIGVCQSGAGGALAMAFAFIGKERCATLSSLGRPPDAAVVASAVAAGIVAFGISTDNAELTVAMLISELVGPGM